MTIEYQRFFKWQRLNITWLIIYIYIYIYIYILTAWILQLCAGRTEWVGFCAVNWGSICAKHLSGSWIRNYHPQNTTHITMTSQWAWWRLKSPASRLFTQSFIQTQIKENINAPRHWPLRGEFTGDRWIPRTNGQLRGKCFHFMTSSWVV